MSKGYHVLKVSSVSVVEENEAAQCIPTELPKIKMPASPRHHKKYTLEDWQDTR